MNRKLQRGLAAVGAFLALLVPSQAGAQKQEEKEWTWKDREGKTRTRADLDKILDQHKPSLETGRAGVPADLSRADLDSADLGGADLVNANLTGAKLRSANLTRANLAGANLTDASLLGADLRSAQLYRANLTRANLMGANLTGAGFTDAELKDANLSVADLQGTIFEPKSNPEIRSIAVTNHLELITYGNNPDALVQLRKQFQENGFRTQERKITYALSRRKAERDGPAERWFETVAFDWT